MPDIIDLRSDTVTKPTPEMRQAMADAVVGDDVYGEDPTVRALEEYAAHLLGKEAGLFVTSGTMGNQVAIATYAHAGDEVICEAEAHIFYYEGGAISAIAGAQVRQVPGHRGVLDPRDVAHAIRERNIHYPRTKLVSIENTHNRAGGTVYPLADLHALHEVTQAHGVPLHIDGARLFNAAVAAGVPARAFADEVESVQICLSKGLCAPVGSVLVGSRAFIEEARFWRKRMGGGMRQAGVIAAPGLIALREMVDRSADDHENARYLAESLVEMPGITVDLETVQTNMVIADIAGTGLTVDEFLERWHAAGVLSGSVSSTAVRFVTHHDVPREQVEAAVDRIAAVLGQVTA